MTAADLQRAAESFTFSGGLRLWEPAVQILREAASDYIEVRFIISVPDRETGKLIPVRFSETFPEHLVHGLDDAKSFLLGRLRNFLMHEVCEGIVVDGVRVLDPHRHEGLTRTV